MKKDVLITIKGVMSDVTEERLELVTTGTLYQKNDHYYIVYKESQEIGMLECTTTLKVSENTVAMLRYGKDHNTQMTFEKNVKHVNGYDTPYGTILMSVRTKKLEKDLDLDGGSIKIVYEIEVDHQVVNENTLTIEVKVRDI